MAALMDGESLEIGAIAQRSNTNPWEVVDWLFLDFEVFDLFQNAHNVQALLIMSDLLGFDSVMSDDIETYLDLAW